MDAAGLQDAFAFYQVFQPYPLHSAFVAEIRTAYDEVLVLEETAGVIEMQLRDYRLVRGKLSGAVPEAGELLPEAVERLLRKFAGQPVAALPEAPRAGGKRPTLCPGCPHRASFYAIKKAAPKGIYPSDIGCYTLGVNLGAVDTVLCMGAAIGQAAGLHQAYRITGQERDIIATVGDSTFVHAGIPPLIDAVVQGARFVLVILDNTTTAMTGNQPTPAQGTPAGKAVDIASVVGGCGVAFCRSADPLNLPAFTSLLKEALAFSRNQGVAVVIAKSPCLVDKSLRHITRPQAMVDATCTGCRVCTAQFECPALVYDETSGTVTVDVMICSGCGVCLDVCPVKAIKQGGEP
jgi:indolepyruvate ferredoxin oxidoreductase alpha subunit